MTIDFNQINMLKEKVCRWLFTLFYIIISQIGISAQISYKAPDTLFDYFLSTYQYDNAEKYGDSMILVAEERNDSISQLYFLIKLCDLNNLLGRNLEANEYFKDAMRIFPQHANNYIRQKFWMAGAYVNYNIGNLDIALRFISKLLDDKDNINDASILGALNSLYGTIFIQNGNLNEAKKYLISAAQISDSLSEMKRYIHRDQLLLGLYYLMANKLDSSFICLDRAKTVTIEMEDTLGIARSAVFLASFYRATGQISNWEENIKKAISLAKKSGYKTVMGIGYGQLMNWELTKKNYKKALEIGANAIALFKEESMPAVESFVDSMFYVAHKNLGEETKAIAFLEAYHKNKAKFVHVKYLESALQKDFLFRMEEKDLKLQNQSLSLLLEKRKSLILLLLVFTLLIGISGAWLLKNQHAMHVSALFKKEKLVEELIELKEKPVTTSELSESELLIKERKLLFDQFNELLQTEKLYLDPNLNQQMIISIFSTNKRYLYEAITQNAEFNYNELINLYRVNEAKAIIKSKLLSGGNPLANKELYSEAGFNSLSSFYRAFKFFTGLTPREYIKEFEKTNK